MIVYDALVSALRAQAIPVIEQPQAALTTGPNLELWLEGFTLGGEKQDGVPYAYETLILKAEVTASGVARQFVSGLRPILRKMLVFGEDGLAVPVTVDHDGTPKTHTITARFEKTSPGGFDYESEEAPMPARFRETWRITITYRATIIPTEEG
jgi:hypothetical protein